MDNFVFDVPIAAHHPYEQNLSDYDDYFLRDLDAIFKETPLLQFGSAEFGSAEPTIPDDQTHQQQQQHQQHWADHQSSLYEPTTPQPQTYHHQTTVEYPAYETINYQQYSNDAHNETLTTTPISSSIDPQQQIALPHVLSAEPAQSTLTILQPEPNQIPSVESSVPEPKSTTSLEQAQPEKYVCMLCSRSFATQRSRNCHITRIHAATGIRFASNKSKEDTQTDRHQCIVCDAPPFATKKTLAKHIAVEHPTLQSSRRDETPFACPMCSQTFATRSARQQHKRAAHATKTSTKKSSKEDYPQPKTPAKDLKCDRCPRTFAFRTMLNHHRSTAHAPQPLHPCCIEFCDQVFTSSALLLAHQQHGHHHRKSPPIGLTMSKRGGGALLSDLVAATTNSIKSDASVRCPEPGCGREFANVVVLRRHQTIHRLRSYACVQCSRYYHSKAAFDMHTRLSHPADDVDDVLLVADEDLDSGPQECGACAQLFENRRVLRQHRQFCELVAEELPEVAEREAQAVQAAQERRLRLTGKPMAIEEVYVKQEPYVAEGEEED